MNNYDSILLKCFLILTPLSWIVVIIAVLTGASDDWVNHLAGVCMFLWIIFSIYLLVKMIYCSSFRENLLTKLFKQKVADEREVFISGDATNKTYFFSASIILTLLFFSVLKISVVNVTKEDRDLGKRGSISIGFGYSIFSEKALAKSSTEFSLKELPISKEALLSLMLILQLASYHLYFRRKLQLASNNARSE